MGKCIFYLPYHLDEKAMGARMLRPRKLIQAFKDIGYEVTVITGVSSVRRPLIREVKKQIKNGVKYDFMYTEAHTEPTLLTDPNHLPTHPFLDYSFFRFVRKHGIKIGLFYPDIYWKFPNYGAALPSWKRVSALKCYRYDVKQFKKYLSKFYVADMKLCDYLDEKKLTDIASELLPGADRLTVEPKTYEGRSFRDDPLQIFYVGGLGGHYEITDLVKAVSQINECELTVCCREAEWEKEKEKFSPYLNERIHIVHKHGEELEEYYKKADLCSLLFKRADYMEMAKPFKAFEYLAHETPVLSTKGNAIGDFVEENQIGWNIDFDADEISKTLKMIIDDPKLLEEKRKNCAEVKKVNLWMTRAQQVVDDLKQSEE